MLRPGILCLAILAVAIGSGSAAARSPRARTITLSQSATNVPRFDFLEVTLNVANPVAVNPFRNVTVTASFGLVGQTARTLDGFCDSNDGTVFRVRFTPRVIGNHQYTISYADGAGTETFTGTFTCVSGTLPGFLRVDSANPLHFVWEGTGQHFYHVGNTVYAIAGLTDEAEIRRSVDHFRSKGVNKLRFQNYARMRNGEFGATFDSTWNGNLLVFQGTDHTRYNLPHWQKMERLLRYMLDRSMIASVIMVIDRGSAEFPAAGSANEDLYYRYGVARYAAFSNVTFDLGNEHNEYRSVPSWANRLGGLIKQWNPYDNLTSAHAYADHVYKNASGTAWCDWQIFQQYGTAAQVNQWIIANRNAPQPAVNEEYGYEGTTAGAQGHGAVEPTVRRNHWAIAMAGGYGTYGDNQAAFVTGKIGPGKVLASGALSHLASFFGGRTYWAMQPDNARVSKGFCLSRAGSEYLAYVLDGGTFSVNLTGISGTFAAAWFNPRTGQTTSAGSVSGGGSRSFTAPSADDWALSLVAASAPPVASFTATPTSGSAPLAVAFDASSSSDSNGTITAYSWSFGDGGSGSGRTINHSYASPGSYTARLTVTDDSGLTNSATRTITVTVADGTPPVISAVQVLNGTSNSARIVWTTNEAASSQVEYGTTASYGTATPVDPALVTSHSVQLSGLAPSRLYHFRVRSIDAAGDPAVSADITFTTLSADLTPPVISTVAVSFTGGGANPATFTWTTNEPSTSRVEYGTTTAYGSFSMLDSNLLMGHSVVENDFVGGTTYQYRVRSHDSAGNEAVSGNFSFVYPGGTAAPQIASPAAGTVFAPGQTVTATGTGTNLSWSIDRIGDGLAAFAAGSGPSITFTVPADATSGQTIQATLTGDGGTDIRSFAISTGSGLVGHWTFDEGSGAGAVDASGNGNTGTLRNGPVWTAGKVGSALRFDGVNDAVSIPDSASLDGPISSLTVAAWVYRVSNTSGWTTVSSRQAGSSSGEHYFLGFSNGNYRWFVTTSGGISSTALGGPAPVGQWIHVAGTFNGSTVTLYVNGVAHFSTSHSGSLAADATPHLIGGNANDSTGEPQHVLDGLIDDVRMYRRSLNSAEIQGLLGGGTPGALAVTNLQVSTGRAYTANATAAAGALHYIDRSYTVSSLSAPLAGGVLVRTANDDKSVTTTPHLRFTVNVPATVWVCYDKRGTSAPAWLNDGTWAATTEVFAVSDAGSSPMRVYRKAVPAGQVSLGGNLSSPASGAGSHYVVIVKAAN